MNEAHLHLVFNHFPIIGSIFGFCILLTGIVLKNKSVQQTSFVLLFFTAIFGVVTMQTGEGAEELMETIGASEVLMHEHEEIAEKFVILLYLTGAVALLSLITSLRNHSKAKLFATVTLFLALASSILSGFVGASGGEIRHEEIRKASPGVTPTLNNENHEEE